jgi:hypothetical protein
MFTDDQIIYWNPGTFVLPSGSLLRAWPNSLDSVHEYAFQANGALLTYKAYQVGLSDLRRTLGYSQWVCGSEDYWSYQYESLLWQASMLGIAGYRIREAESLASVDIFRACRLLVNELHRRVIENVAFLQAGLLVARILASILLVQFAATVFHFRNKITLQRRFYLTHGSHPIEDSVYRKGDRFVSQIGGCIPAFQS